MTYNFLNIAIDFASEIHKNETDKAGNPYILHPLAVSDMLEDPIDKTIAVLHDVAESDPTSIEKLISLNAPVEVIEAVKLLTRNPEDTYMDYISNLAASRNIRAIRVKLADITHNTSKERVDNLTKEKALSLKKRYDKAKEILIPLYKELTASSQQ